ncbi:hypothetical protein DPMN_021745 [Dreissena polymorpha]|uniref:Uncharacterized protein n=1 Tax=Dreissena polymorpha TaxID=45954 RepID=A0A9D4SC07_DREPO|nr:hypothetical protein DPMN_021745 [Dreissena polymorpha]
MRIARFFRKGKTVERYRAIMALLFEKYRVAFTETTTKELRDLLNDVEFALKKGFLKVKIHHPQLVKMSGHQHIKIHPLQPVKRFCSSERQDTSHTASQEVNLRKYTATLSQVKIISQAWAEDDHTISDEDEEELKEREKGSPHKKVCKTSEITKVEKKK